MSIESILKACSLVIFLFLSSYANGQVPEDISAYMPSKAEMRKGLEDSGITPEQIEKILNSMDFPNENPPNVKSLPNTPQPCADTNENDICDMDESDPIITQCRKVYQSELHKSSRGLYGDALGRNSVEIAQTCLMAAAGGSMTYIPESGWIHDMDKLMETSSYWQAVLSHGRYLDGSDIIEMDDLSDERVKEIISTFPRDLQAMLRAAGTEAMRSTSGSIHDKCQNVRSRVKDNYRSKALVDTICIKYVPDDKEAETE